MPDRVFTRDRIRAVRRDPKLDLGPTAQDERKDPRSLDLELTLAAVDDDELPGVHADAAHLGDGLICERVGVGAARWRLGRQAEPKRGRAWSVAAHGDPLRGCGVASREPGLMVMLEEALRSRVHHPRDRREGRSAEPPDACEIRAARETCSERAGVVKGGCAPVGRARRL